MGGQHMQNQASFKIIIMTVSGEVKLQLSLFHLFTSHKVTVKYFYSLAKTATCSQYCCTLGDIVVKFYNVALEINISLFVFNKATA